MMFKPFFALMVYCLTNSAFIFGSTDSLTINIISRKLDNGAGKEVDIIIIKNELERLGHTVRLIDFKTTKKKKQADINVFLAQFDSSWFKYATLNWFIPNAEFCNASPEELLHFDLILCKTDECLRIFSPINKKAIFMGFTSLDRYDPNQTKNFSTCLHLVGKSRMKGTEEVFKAWKYKPTLPHLLLTLDKDNVHALSLKKHHQVQNLQLVTDRLSHDEVIKLQNECGIHICPSKTEGFGHYILEGMSTGAVIVTTDAPPMNEFIKDRRCLVKYSETDQQRYGTIYKVDTKALARKVEKLCELTEEELMEIGGNNREEYLRRDAKFKQRFEELMKQTVKELEEYIRKIKCLSLGPRGRELYSPGRSAVTCSCEKIKK